ncbi:MbnP family copper-binding protein [Sphingomonas sp.]|uniref:MbnP family copper-binding protein n=1 Tax=Sphingomonas sp. TaxID=28214 RepID=UPI000DB537A1|nr:MbnP family copper-binding protein [Sphingomonas sp.]PZU11631.1 MAG: metallo-mystery pair system four-Cys motif protein [Sphingomonas sp.]
MLTGMLLLAATAAADRQVEINFEGVVGATPFRCGQTYAGIGKPAATVRPTDLRFYVTNVALIDGKGHSTPVKLDQDGLWQQRDVALIDLEDGSGPCRGGNSGINRAVKGKVPAGAYVGLSFRVGLPEDLNHGDATIAKSPLNFTAMFWSWQAGYRFFKVDLETVGAPMADLPGTGGMAGMKGMSRQTGFAVHIGSTGCGAGAMTARPAATCSVPNRAAVRFEKFDPAKDKVVVDLAAILSGTDVGHNTPNTAPGCMSGDDPDCGPIFAAFGLPFPGQPAPAQRAFSKR